MATKMGDVGRATAGSKMPWRKLLSFQDTDAGNAEAFELLHGHRFRYNHTNGKWLVWTGRHWAEDKDGEANRAALSTLRARLSAAITIGNHGLMERRTKWALGSEAAWRMEAMLSSARNIRSLATRTEQYDRDPFLLTVATLGRSVLKYIARTMPAVHFSLRWGDALETRLSAAFGDLLSCRSLASSCNLEGWWAR
jgi:hypothetical protein